VELTGEVSPWATPKDLTLRLLQEFGAAKLLGKAVELHGPVVEKLDLSGRITVSSMGTEMGAIIVFFPPNSEFLAAPVAADADAVYEEVFTVEVSGLGPLVSRPGHPE